MLKRNIQINSNMQNLVVVFTFSVLYWKHPFFTVSAMVREQRLSNWQLSSTQFFHFVSVSTSVNCFRALSNDTHMKELDSLQKFIEAQGWLLLTFFICLHNQLSSFNSIIVMSEKRVHQVDSKNEWLLLSVTFTAKFGLVLS